MAFVRFSKIQGLAQYPRLDILKDLPLLPGLVHEQHSGILPEQTSCPRTQTRSLQF
jgi:hypothetical protein